MYPIPDPAVGDRVMAALVLLPGATFDVGDFTAFLAEQPDLGPKQWPAFVRISTALPRTETFKVIKRRVVGRGAGLRGPRLPDSSVARNGYRETAVACDPSRATLRSGTDSPGLAPVATERPTRARGVNPMRTSALTGAAAAVAALAVVLSGCGSDTKTATSQRASSRRAREHLVNEARDHPAPVAGPEPDHRGLHQGQRHPETGIKMGDPKAPAVKLPVPDGWSTVSSERRPTMPTAPWSTPAPGSPNDPPNIVALMSKLSGNVDPQKILELAPGELRNLPNYQPANVGEAGTLGDHPAYMLDGTFTRGGSTRFIAQKTIVIPAPEGLYVLQLNVEGPTAAGQVLAAATDEIDARRSPSIG